MNAMAANTRPAQTACLFPHNATEPPKIFRFLQALPRSGLPMIAIGTRDGRREESAQRRWGGTRAEERSLPRLRPTGRTVLQAAIRTSIESPETFWIGFPHELLRPLEAKSASGPSQTNTLLPASSSLLDLRCWN